jgi:hypothetical protein
MPSYHHHRYAIHIRSNSSICGNAALIVDVADYFLFSHHGLLGFSAGAAAAKPQSTLLLRD